jgi:catechol-2,3-dioxygenase
MTGERVMNLNHIHLHVASVERAAEFYARNFGMRQHVWHGDVVFMRDEAGMDLALAPTDKVEPFPSWFHIGFRMDDRAAVGALFRRLEGGETPIRTPLTDEGDFAFFRCSDPDGYQIEVYWEVQPA